MTNEEIFALLDRFQKSGVHELKITRGDFSIEMAKAAVVSAPVSAAPLASAVTIPAEGAAPADDALYIKSPMAGTFYPAPSPNDAPFVAIGQTVRAGETVCLMEAMKMLSEVPAPCDCVIELCMQEAGGLVGFDAPLFRYRVV